jgi:hypothetical protein
MTHADVIGLLGGYREVAARLGIERANTVFYWTRADRCIPSFYWPHVAALAKPKHPEITVELLRDAAPPRKKRAA